MSEEQIEAELRKMFELYDDDRLQVIESDTSRRLITRQTAAAILQRRRNDRQAPKVLMREVGPVKVPGWSGPVIVSGHTGRIREGQTLPATDTSPEATDAQIWRANYAGLTVDQLGDIALDEGVSETQRSVALQMFGELQAEARRRARTAAALEGQADPVPQVADVSASMTPNERAARDFAALLQAGGCSPTLMRTAAVQGRKVNDGWAVNHHDEELEVGLVAAFWGRNHMLAYVEIAGHTSRAHEAAAILLAAVNFAKRGA